MAEWAPNADAIDLVGDFNGWRESSDYALKRRNDHGNWELTLPPGALGHRDHYLLKLHWPDGSGERIPAYARRVVQDSESSQFCAQIWDPESPYQWRHSASPKNNDRLFIYEAHVGMAQEREGVGSYEEFRQFVLPRIAAGGYDTIQFMALMEHPYYGSFGYQVSNFFAASSRFGTPDELKALIDEAHGLGLRVIMDLVHSHGVRNEVEGLGRFDGTRCQYFHEGPRGLHPLWDSYLFDYTKPEVVHFLLSNCRFWLDEYRLDGFRFDGITSMLYRHHGLNHAFTHYDEYFGVAVDEDALCYLTLANRVVHAVRPDAVTIAEDVSGMPGLAAPVAEGGTGFDYRMGMGVSDCWFKLTDIPDEEWDLGWLWHELRNRRAEERTVSYVECHDQALVGGKSMIFTLADAAMYGHMRSEDDNLEVQRAIALTKMMRLATAATADAYLNFIGNEFGHPEWIDFPREGNGWSYHCARRQWSLVDDENLKYRLLADFDREMLAMLAESVGLLGSSPVLLKIAEDDGVLVFKRGPAIFCFNFHPSRSYPDYPIEVGHGTYDLLFDSDNTRYGGLGRLEPGQNYPVANKEADEHKRHYIRIYLPCRAAAVIRMKGNT
jgi:1,4-alpha-glucan branching enzyme